MSTAIKLCYAGSRHSPGVHCRQTTYETRDAKGETYNGPGAPMDSYTTMSSSSTSPIRRALCAVAVAALALPSVFAQSPQVVVGETTITGVSQTFQGALGVDFFGGMYDRL